MEAILIVLHLPSEARQSDPEYLQYFCIASLLQYPTSPPSHNSGAEESPVGYVPFVYRLPPPLWGMPDSFTSFPDTPVVPFRRQKFLRSSLVKNSSSTRYRHVAQHNRVVMRFRRLPLGPWTCIYHGSREMNVDVSASSWVLRPAPSTNLGW